ncbi:MAG: beta-lactamase family protein [Clostridia bacterium]|nr:beta-lactamase family protein [Clostridia bacterium]
MFEKVDAYLQETVPGAIIPGCDLLIYRKGELIWRKQYGWRNYKKTEAVRTDDYYYLYSCTKIMTTAAAMSLVEQGKLDLDAPLYKYLPAFADVKLKDGTAPKEPIKIWQLFSMAAGMNYDLKSVPIMEALQKNPNGSTVEIVNAMAEVPLDFEPGTSYQYSLAHDVLAAVIEVITGKNLEQYLREWAWEPLGLTHLSFHLTEESRQKLQAQYVWNAEKQTHSRRGMENPYIFASDYYSGGAGLIAQAEDFAKFLSAVAQGKLLKPETVELWRTPRYPKPAGDRYRGGSRHKPFEYALGVRVFKYPDYTAGHTPVGVFGWDGAAGSHGLIDPENEIAICYMQHVCSCGFAYETVFPTIRELVYEELGF